MGLLSNIISDTVIKGASKVAQEMPDIAANAGKAAGAFKSAFKEASGDDKADPTQGQIDNTCPKCGAPMEIDYDELLMTCPYCDNKMAFEGPAAKDAVREREKTRRKKIEAEKQVKLEEMRQEEVRRSSEEAARAFKWLAPIAAVLLLIAIIWTGVASCTGKSDDKTYAIDNTVASYTEHFDLTCTKNMMFSKYDVDVYVDDSMVYTLDHGSQDTFDLEMNEGTHELRFKEHSGSADGKKTVNITGEAYITAVLHCTDDQIEIQDFSVQTAEEKSEPKQKASAADGADSQTEENNSQASKNRPSKLAYMLDFENGIPEPYTMYIVFNTKKKSVSQCLSTLPDYKYKGTYTGKVGDKVVITWKDGKDSWKDTARWTDGDTDTMVYIDSYDFETEWESCSVKKAEKGAKA